MSGRKLVNEWTVGEYTFREYADTWKGEPVTLFGYTIGDGREWELTESLDKALLSAVAEKYTGPRGAGGTGVGTAADWFALAIGLEKHA